MTANPDLTVKMALEDPQAPAEVVTGPIKRRRQFKMLPQEALTTIAETLQNENAALMHELYVRAAPRLAETITALNTTADAARRGNTGAKESLAAFFKAFDAAREAATARPIKFEAPKPPQE